MKRWLPTREQLQGSRWLRPLGRHLHDDRLWHMNRASVARAVSIGLFFGLLMPVAQIAFAVAGAIVLRAHLAVAAGATLVTNPLTFTPIYWLAYKLGKGILGEPQDDAAAQAIGAQAKAVAAELGWFEGLWYSIQAAGAPLVVGLSVLAVAGAALGYVLVWLLWRPKAPASPEPPRLAAPAQPPRPEP